MSKNVLIALGVLALILVFVFLGKSDGDDYKGGVTNTIKENTKQVVNGTVEKGAQVIDKVEKVMQSDDDKMNDEYITTENGMSLYIFKKDVPNVSNCKGECLKNWPPYYSEKMSKMKGFGVIESNDGFRQLTYNKMPLYLFAKDKEVGDKKGDGVKDLWLLAKKVDMGNDAKDMKDATKDGDGSTMGEM